MKRKHQYEDSDPKVDVIDMAVNVGVDAITTMDLEKQAFTADLWAFIMTASAHLACDAGKCNTQDITSSS